MQWPVRVFWLAVFGLFLHPHTRRRRVAPTEEGWRDEYDVSRSYDLPPNATHSGALMSLFKRVLLECVRNSSGAIEFTIKENGRLTKKVGEKPCGWRVLFFVNRGR